MNRPNKLLTIELLDEALCATLQEKHPYPFDRLLLNEKGWRHVFGRAPLDPHMALASRWLRGLPVELLPADQLLLAIGARQYGGSVDDDSAILLPEAKYCTQGVTEVDFQFETTRQIEDVLRSGIGVVPSCSEFQFWQQVEVATEDGCSQLMDLIFGSSAGYCSVWHLRGNVTIQVRDGAVTICCWDATSEQEAAALLHKRYGTPVDTAGLRLQAASLQARIERLAKRASYFERHHPTTPTTP